jgi:hypothetical protein
LDLTTEQGAQICTDRDHLDRWFDRALTAATAADVFMD